MTNISTETSRKGSRFYTDETTGEKFPSVTTVISKVATDVRALQKWRESVGVEEAAKISASAASLGTKVHKVNELFMTQQEIPDKYLEQTDVMKRHELFKPFLANVNPLLVEQEIIWKGRMYEQTIGFGGTPDLVGLFQDPQKLGLDIEPFVFLLDFKNWRASKSAQNLITNYLQLAAYTAAVNTRYGYKIQNAFILGTTVKKLHIYHLSQRELNWYWVWFIECLKKFHNLPTNFTRSALMEFSVGYQLEGVDEEGSKIWGQKEENYLPKKLALLLEEEST